ncbi:MAG: hypothetical protein K2X38_08630 [Gemmataceae bacterium]|nr:hypothetical protein [Gemmataceae bacterium]
MNGLLSDVNIEGYLAYLERLLETLGLRKILEGSNIQCATFADLGLDPKTDDRTLWNWRQKHQWTLLTDNRNSNRLDSLGTTLADSWKSGHPPVITIANKRRFQRDGAYAQAVAAQIGDIMFGLVSGPFRDQPRIFVPR